MSDEDVVLPVAERASHVADHLYAIAVPWAESDPSPLDAKEGPQFSLMNAPTRTLIASIGEGPYCSSLDKLLVSGQFGTAHSRGEMPRCSNSAEVRTSCGVSAGTCRHRD